MLHCALCEREFNQKAELSRHWCLQHEKEASLFLKSLPCRNCQFEASSLLVMQSHWQEQHRDLPFECLCWWICMSCAGNFLQLEAHVCHQGYQRACDPVQCLNLIPDKCLMSEDGLD